MRLEHILPMHRDKLSSVSGGLHDIVFLVLIHFGLLGVYAIFFYHLQAPLLNINLTPLCSDT
jgi:hypothetical protein